MTKEKQLAVAYKNPTPTPAATETGDELAELAGGIDTEEWMKDYFKNVRPIRRKGGQ